MRSITQVILSFDADVDRQRSLLMFLLNSLLLRARQVLVLVHDYARLIAFPFHHVGLTATHFYEISFSLFCFCCFSLFTYPIDASYIKKRFG